VSGDSGWIFPCSHHEFPGRQGQGSLFEGILNRCSLAWLRGFFEDVRDDQSVLCVRAWVCRHISPTTLARRPAKVWSELLRWLVLMMQKLWISRRTTEESSHTSRRSAPVRRARLPSKYRDQLDDIAWVS
jgi:hypothetical protein